MSDFLRQHAGHLIMLGGPLVPLAAMLIWLRLTDPDRPREGDVNRLVLVVAALWVPSAGIHLLVTPDHFRESPALGAFFLVLVGVQLTYAGWLALRPSGPLLLAGVVTNLSLIALWAWSRTVSVPFGLGGREPVGVVDLSCTALEALSTVVALRLFVQATQGPTTRARPLTRPVERFSADAAGRRHRLPQALTPGGYPRHRGGLLRPGNAVSAGRPVE